MSTSVQNATHDLIWLNLSLGGSLRYESNTEEVQNAHHATLEFNLQRFQEIQTIGWCQITSMAVVKSVLEKYRKPVCGGRFVPLPKTHLQLETQLVLVFLFLGGGQRDTYIYVSNIYIYIGMYVFTIYI